MKKLLIALIMLTLSYPAYAGGVQHSLTHSAEIGDIRYLEQALARANIDGKDHKGGIAIIAATFFGHEEIVSILLDKGANIEIKDDSGRTALMVAVKYNQAKAVDTNIKNNAVEIM